MNPHNMMRDVWSRYAGLRRRLGRAGSELDALAHFSGADRSDLEQWIRETAERHGEYRAAQSMPIGSVAVICVTNRPQFIGNIVDNVMRQTSLPEHVAVVVNLDESDADLPAVDARLDEIRRAGIDVVLSWRPAAKSLGFCLNVTMAATDARFIAKFDDDDRYGPHYLSDALRAHDYAGAGIIGKASHYALRGNPTETVLQQPGAEFSYTARLAESALVIDRARAGGLWFRDVSTGEGDAIITDCNRRGIATFAADRFNYVRRDVARDVDDGRSKGSASSTILIGAGVCLDAVDR